MNSIKILLSLLLFTTFLSCENQSSETSQPTTPTIQNVDKHDDNNETLELNQGEKWTISKEMIPYLTNSDNLINQYLSNKDTLFHKLGKQLHDEKSNLVNSCNMEGKAHDELHKWLVPYIDLIDELNETNKKEDAEKIILKMQSAFQEFHHFFAVK